MAMDKGGGKTRSMKDKEMAARLKREGLDRHTGRCCICYRSISNGIPTFNHYCSHARGFDTEGGSKE